MVIREILARFELINSPIKKSQLISQLTGLSKIRGLQQLVIQIAQEMALQFNFKPEDDEFFKIGKLEGRLEGKLEGKLEDAKAMIRSGLDASLVSRVTGLSIAKIETLRTDD